MLLKCYDPYFHLKLLFNIIFDQYITSFGKNKCLNWMFTAARQRFFFFCAILNEDIYHLKQVLPKPLILVISFVTGPILNWLSWGIESFVFVIIVERKIQSLFTLFSFKRVCVERHFESTVLSMPNCWIVKIYIYFLIWCTCVF